SDGSGSTANPGALVSEVAASATTRTGAKVDCVLDICPLFRGRIRGLRLPRLAQPSAGRHSAHRRPAVAGLRTPVSARAVRSTYDSTRCCLPRRIPFAGGHGGPPLPRGVVCEHRDETSDVV